MEDLQGVKQRFGIVGNATGLNRSISKALLVAPTDISVLVFGESGVGKEVIPKIIHQGSYRKHAKMIAVNCGAIPEGTIDSELFGHQKGAFTGAVSERDGYFQEADGGTIFLDEIGELPLTTQAKLLRVLETGEFIKVGSSQVQKTSVRIVAATNVDLLEAIKKGSFREDLYYRVNTVEIHLPSLRDRRDDIHLLFRKFALDFATKYGVPPVQLSDKAIQALSSYHWPGNVRQLRNVVEQLSILEKERLLDQEVLVKYLPNYSKHFPALLNQREPKGKGFEPEAAFYNLLFDMKAELSALKKTVFDILSKEPSVGRKVYDLPDKSAMTEAPLEVSSEEESIEVREEEMDRLLALEKGSVLSVSDSSETLHKRGLELIKKTLKECHGSRKKAANKLGISERTLYRKIKRYGLEKEG